MKTAIILAVLLAAPLARAQDVNFGALDEHANVATVTTGAENGLVVGAGYAHVVPVADHPLVLGGDLTVVAAGVDLDDFQLRAGALAPIAAHGRWKLIGGLTGTLRDTKNEIARMIGVGTDVMVLAGHYAPRWFAAAEVGFDWALATHIAASETYRMEVYAGARDGWYGNPGGTFRYGLQAGTSFGANDVILRAGKLTDVAGDPALFPFYATLTYGRRW